METFHEDVAGTVLFCFLACLGSLVLAVQAKGWHGLCPYGGRLRVNLSRALAAALFISAYALYFSDPQHRNVRNIEGFMSLVSLVMGALLALVFLALSASISEEVRRWLVRARYSKLSGGTSQTGLSRLVVEGAGEIMLRGSWSVDAEGLLVILEPVPAARRLAHVLASCLPSNKDLAMILPLPRFPSKRNGDGISDDFREKFATLIDAAIERVGVVPPRSRLLIVGHAFRFLLMSPDALRGLLEKWRPERIVLLAPPLENPSLGSLADSLVSNTPKDLLQAFPGTGGLPISRFRRLIRAWIIAFLLVFPPALFLPWIFRARWWFVSGPSGAAVVSFWLAYHVRDPFREGESKDSSMARTIPTDSFFEHLRSVPSCRCIMVIAADDLGGFHRSSNTVPNELENIELVEEPRLLRGKMSTWPSLPARLERWLWG